MGLPIVGSLPSEIMMAQNLGLYDQMWGVWLMKANFLGMYFLVFFASFQSLPKDFAEAARMDGASNFRILFQISLPMVRNTFFVVLLLKFIDFWNDYQTPMIYLRSFPTAALGIYSFSFSYGTQSSWPPMKITGSMILLLPVLIVFLCFHDKMIGNVSMGGIKE
jgi:ABC-type glycerol-3-phosphate transport system permease component